ncbi:MAG: hypothetical protein WBX21_07695 [Aestuariivirga sp.]
MNVTRRRFHEIVLGSLGLGALNSAASAQLVTKYAEDLRNGEFN